MTKILPMEGEKRWFHASPIPLDRVVFLERCLQKNKNLNARTLTKIKNAFCIKLPHEHTRPDRLGRRWPEGIYVGDTRFQLNCQEKDGLVIIRSMSYDKRAFRRPKKGG